MPAQLKKLNNYNKPLWRFILSPKRLAFLVIAVIVFTGYTIVNLQNNAYAATGINRTINFQGKVVNSNGTNVADGQYTFVFKLYDAASGGSNPWTETQSGVQVTAGIFRVSLGSVTTFASAGIDFNTDNLYLGINFNSDGEMTPRVRFAAVPYAINAEKVAGLTVTNTTGTLTIPNSKTIQFGGAFTTDANDISFTTSGGTTLTLPTTGTLATLGGTENLSNKTFTSTITISGVATDITTGSNEALTLAPNGTGNVLVQAGAGGQSALIVDKTGLGDIFAASSSGTTKFVIKNDGTASSSAGFTIDANGGLVQSTRYQSLTLGGGSTGELTIGRTSQKVWLPGFDCSGSGNGGKLTTTSGGVLTCSADGAGSSGDNFWQYNSSTGIVANGNLTTDLLLGATATNAAKFSVLGIASGTNPTASVSATSGSNAGNGIVIAGNGTIQSLRNNSLILGGNTSGALILKSNNATVFQNVGTGNIMVGESAGNGTSTGTVGTFMGIEAGLNSNADGNTFIGAYAGRTTSSGSNNTFVGRNAGYANNAGVDNAFFGFEAGRYTNASGNTSLGKRAGYSNNSGTNNVFLGYEAGESPVGANANTSGANNVFIGYQSGPGSTTQLSNATAIGYQALVNASNALVLGGTGANAVQVGIGTTSPVSVLQVVGGNMGGNAAFILNQTGVSTDDIFAASSSGTTKFVIKNDGTASSSAGFTIDANGGLVQSTRYQSLTLGGGSTGELTIGRTSQKVWLPGFDCSGSGNGGKLTTTSGGVLTCSADGGGSGSNWTLSSVNGTLNPINNTLDLLVGGTSTQSAMFSVLGIASGTNPSASVSAQSGANANKGIYMSGDGSLQSVRNNTLTIGGNTTGDIQFKPGNVSTPTLYLATNGNAGIGTTTPGSALDIVGSLLLGANSTLDTRASGTLTIGNGTNTSGLTLGKSGATTTFNSTSWTATPTISGLVTGTLGFSVATGQSYSGAGTVTLSSASNNDLTITAQGSGNTIITSDYDTGIKIGSSTNTPAILSVFGGIGSNAGLIINRVGVTDDIFAASSSGTTKFVIKNDGTASSSAGFTIDANGGLVQSTRYQSLTLGGGSTGELTIGRTSQKVWLPGFDCSGSGNGGKLTTTSGGVLTCSADGGILSSDNFWQYNSSVGIIAPGNLTAATLFGGTSTASAILRIAGTANSGTVSVASISADTSFAALSIDNISAVGDLLSASSSSNTQFVIKNNGSVGIGNSARIPTAQLDVAGAASISSQLSFRTGIGSIQTTANNTLTIGGATTGFITLDSGSGQIIILDNTNISGNLTGLTGLTLASGAITLGGSIGTGQCLTGGTSASWSACAAGTWVLDAINGVHTPINNTLDLLVGGTSTQSAMFSVLGIASGTNPSASVSAQSGANANKGIYMSGDGSLQSVRNNTLTIGGNTTGDIQFKPGNASTPTLYLASNGAVGFNGSFGALGQCLLSNGAGATVSWGGCAAGAAGGWFNLISSQGTIVPVNQTLDLLWGGNSTASAGFRIAGATKNYGTVAAASVSANTSFAGLVVDNRGTGELLTASSSGLTRFTIYNSGDVVIGGTSDAGYKLDVKGSVRIGNNTTTDDIVKDSSVDFTQSGYSITTNDSVNTVTTSGDQLKLVTDLIGAGATLTAPAADQTTGTNVTTGSVAFQRPDKKFVVFVGGAATSKIYDTTTGTWIAGPSSAGAVSLGAGARAFQRQNGSFLVVHGGAATTTTIYQPGGSANFGTAIAGPATTAAVGAGSLVIRRSDGKVLLIHGNTSTTTSVHDPAGPVAATSLIGTFAAGPATTGNVVAGSFAFQRADGKWIVGLGGGATTNLYDPSSSGVGGGGAFLAGPSLSAGLPAAGTHVIQLPDGRFMVLVGGSTATQIYDWKANSFSAGSTMTVTIGAGAHSFQRSDGKWVVVAGGNSTSLMLYDPTSGANGTFSNLASGLSAAAGVGSLTFQRPDGKYIVVHGNGVQTTTLYDAGWNTTGTWTSEDILNTKISTYSAMMWSANPQSANNNARIDAETINVAVKTGDTLTSLGNNSYRSLQDSGDLVRAYGNSQYAKIQVSFSVPVRSYPGTATAYIQQSNIWEGEGGTFLRRSLIQPTLFSMRIQNPLVSYGDPTGEGDPAFGRNFATASAQLEGVVTDNSNRLSLSPLRNLPTATASAGFIIASASADLGGSAGVGAHTIERNNGQFITILGNTLTTTRVYDSDTNTWSAGPDLPNVAGAGAHSFLMPDGRFFVVLGGTTNKTAIFDPQANLFQAGPNLFGNVGIGANTFQRPDGFFVILNGGATSATNILDPFTMAVTQGPFTAGATPNVGAGALNIRRADGRILVILGNGNAIATGTNVYDPASNTFAAGPALVGGTVNTGGNAIQLSTGRIILFKSTATSNYLDPIQNAFTAGPTPLANGAGSFIIPRSDGKILKATGATNTTSIIDPQAGTAVTGTSAPTLPCSVNTGAHVFQRPTGEYVLICGSTGSGNQTAIIDAGWNLGGTYTTEQIQVPNLSSTSSLFWKNSGQGTITVKYRTAASQQTLGVASWKDLPQSGSYISPAAGDTWIQARFDLQGALQDLPGAKTRVWTASDSGGGMVYYRPVQAPVLQYWKLMNIQDPTLLTLSSGGSNVFRFSSDGQAYTSDNGAWNSGGADLAERYQSQDALQAGEVVSLDRLHPQNTKRSTTAYDQHAMGVVSTQPGFVAGAYTENSFPIALVGRVPVKVSNENGEIKAGDYLTSASIPGYAMKATVAGRVIGQAMEDFTFDQVQDCPKFGAGNLTTTQCGTITVFVNLTSYNGESVEVAMHENGFALREEELPMINGMDFTPGTDARRQQEVLYFLKTQKDNGQGVYTDRIAATQEIISPQIVTDLLVAKKIKAESIEGLEIITNSIEKLTDQLASGSAVVNFSDRLNSLSLNQKDFENQMASLSAKLDKMGAMNILSFISDGSQSGDLTMVNNFASYGTTTLSEVSVMNTMTIGSGSTLTLSNNSINTLGEELSIQPLRQAAVNFLGGLIRFDTDGKATFAEDVTFAKNVGVAGVMTAHTVASTELQLGQGITTIVSDTEVTSTAAAGLVTLKKNTDHVKVNNTLVRNNSFIFITPKTKTQQQLFLLDQIEGESFTVGVGGKAEEDIRFNYLIVN